MVFLGSNLETIINKKLGVVNQTEILDLNGQQRIEME